MSGSFLNNCNRIIGSRVVTIFNRYLAKYNGFNIPKPILGKGKLQKFFWSCRLNYRANSATINFAVRSDAPASPIFMDNSL